MESVNYNNLNYIERKNIREEYIKIQKWLCMYCWEDLNKQPPNKIMNININWKYFPDNFLKYPIHLQHNHDTWMTEWSVHSYCNAVMWQYEWR